jgi:hypothetical protein
MNGPTARFHAPVVHDLGTAAGFIDQRAQKFVHGDIVPGFFHHLAFGGGARRLTVVELALGQNPFVALAQAHDGDQRRLPLPQYNASRRQNGRSRHLSLPALSHLANPVRPRAYRGMSAENRA